MRCSFCYVPFDGTPIVEATCLRVVDHIRNMNPATITFAGGDPLMYSFFPTLLEIMYDGQRYIQVDTNTKCMRNEHIPILKHYVNLLGVPLDGSTPYIHSQMRSDLKHFDTVLKWLGRMTAAGVPVKVNTVVSSQNQHDIVNIGALLCSLKIECWSLYQFWPMSYGLQNIHQHRIGRDEYWSVVSHVQRDYPELNITGGDIQERNSGYFFVTHMGQVYTVNSNDHRLYTQEGSLFDPSTIARWLQFRQNISII